METTVVYWGFIGRMEKKMETTIVYWGYIGSGKPGKIATLDFCEASLVMLVISSCVGK